ncbi:hypothetical protein FSARC_1540 [Fusarium sarcochroum]|uniref:Uncharacterized protein n=1 Tax=Fusarium sarcochroum TaxID=1208366 RepID=A0A8H4U8J7_9HYPO|nr:hypothetical protein FSARC_1540 [Fusarium sarcochroum]
MDLPVHAASTDDGMELYATGFNAWNQLVFEPSPSEEPDDIFTFSRELTGNSISRVVPDISFTAVQRNDTWVVAGGPASRSLYSKDNKRFLFDSISAISGDDKVLMAQDLDPLHPAQAIVEYSSLAAWNANDSTNTWPCKSPVRQIVAHDVGFVILLGDGSVLSCGDPRFQDCLGRVVDESCPPHIPSLVPDLSDLGEPVKKISANGYIIAALTEGGGLYLWGMQSPGSYNRHNAFTDLDAIPNYVEVDGDKDVQDIAVGESHAIALTTDGCVYVMGDNTNGQIGLGWDAREPVKSWSKMNFKPSPGWEVVAVEAGTKSSFIVTAKAKPK